MENEKDKKWVQLLFIHWCASKEGIENGITYPTFVQWLNTIRPLLFGELPIKE